MGYFHGYIDGVDYVFVDHACYQGKQGDIYGGDRQSIQFRCTLSSCPCCQSWRVAALAAEILTEPCCRFEDGELTDGIHTFSH